MDKKEIMDKIENKLQGMEFYWSESPMRKYELIEMYHGLLGKDKNISVEFVGTFQGESFEIDDLEVFDGDYFYKIECERYYAHDIMEYTNYDFTDYNSNWFDSENGMYTIDKGEADWLESFADTIHKLNRYKEMNGKDFLVENNFDSDYDDMISLVKWNMVA